MPNPQNLVPFTSEQSHEQAVINGRKGGIAQGIAKRERKSREERIRFIFSLAVQSPKVKQMLAEMGIDATEMDNETAMDARMVIETLSKGNVNAYKALKEELYGKPNQKVENTNIEIKPILPKPQKKE